MDSYLISKLIYQYYKANDILEQRKVYDFILRVLTKVYNFNGVQINKFLMSEISKLENRDTNEILFDGSLSDIDIIKQINNLDYINKLSALTLSELFLALELSTTVIECHANRRYQCLNDIGKDRDALAKVNVIKESAIIEKQDDLIFNIIKAIKTALPFDQISECDLYRYLYVGHCEVVNSIGYILDSRRRNLYDAPNDLSYYNFIVEQNHNKEKKIILP